MICRTITYYGIPDWRVRWLLAFEWCALPIGAGFTASSSLFVQASIAQGDWIALFFALIGLSYLAVGIWRPVHRRLGLRRDSQWGKPPLRPHRHRRPKGECAFCDQYGDASMMPHHDASKLCESGKRPHCTCDICY